MSKNFYEGLFITCLLVSLSSTVLLIGVWVGKNTKPNIEKIVVQNTTSTVLISERKDKCTQLAGGIYRLYYNDYTEKYVDICSVPEETVWREEYVQ